MKVKKAKQTDELKRLMDRLRWTVALDDADRTAEIAALAKARQKKKSQNTQSVVQSPR